MVQDLEGEVWKDIPDYEGYYQVSNLGRVKSILHKRKTKHKPKDLREKIMTPGRCKGNYLQVCLRINGKARSTYIHQVAMWSFYGKSNLTIDHINEDKNDNRLVNLRFCTQRMNNIYSKIKLLSRKNKYIGVMYKRGFWVASITINKKQNKIGKYSTEYEAYEKYMEELYKIDLGAYQFIRNYYNKI